MRLDHSLNNLFVAFGESELLPLVFFLDEIQLIEIELNCIKLDIVSISWKHLLV